MIKRFNKTVIIAFALACGLLLLPGCSSDSAWEKPAEETEASEETNTETTTEAEVQWQSIRLTDNYSFSLPEYSEEFTDFERTEGFNDERRFVLDNGDIEVRSFVIEDEGFLFPDAVDYLYEGDEDAEIGYREFFDTAAAVADDEVYDDDGKTVYRRAYFWPDGGDLLISLSVTSYSEEDAKAAGEDILETVEYAGAGGKYYMGGEVPPNADEALTPSQEEIDNAMMQDIQDAMQEYEYDEGYVDYDPSLGRRGR